MLTVLLELIESFFARFHEGNVDGGKDGGPLGVVERCVAGCVAKTADGGGGGFLRPRQMHPGLLLGLAGLFPPAAVVQE